MADLKELGTMHFANKVLIECAITGLVVSIMVHRRCTGMELAGDARRLLEKIKVHTLLL